LFVSDFGDDYKVLYHNDGDASFTDVSYKAGIAQPTIPFVGWGDGFFDYDNDGWLDLFEVNGHVYPQVDQHDWGTTFAERPLLFHNIPDANGKDRKFEVIPPVVGTGLADVIPGRGMAYGDLFNDGKIDVIIKSRRRTAGLAAQCHPTLIMGRDETCRRPQESARCDLRDGLSQGAWHRGPQRQVLVAGVDSMRMRQDVLSSGSYISANDPRHTSDLAMQPTQAQQRFTGLPARWKQSAAGSRSHLHH